MWSKVSRSRTLSIVIVLGMMVWSCGSQPPSPAEQLAQGQELFQTHCARCHGAQGEGRVGPALIGPVHGLRGYGTAQGLYAYTSKIMPYDAPGTLQKDEYWAILAFILRGNGYLPADTRLDEGNAANIRFPQR